MFCFVISWTSFFSLLLSFPFIARRHSAPLSWLIETIHWTYIFISHIFPFSRSIHLNKLHKQKLFSALLLMSCEYRRKLPFFYVDNVPAISDNVRYERRTQTSSLSSESSNLSSYQFHKIKINWSQAWKCQWCRHLFDYGAE